MKYYLNPQVIVYTISSVIVYLLTKYILNFPKPFPFYLAFGYHIMWIIGLHFYAMVPVFYNNDEYFN